MLESTTYPGTTREVMQPILETRRPRIRPRFLPRLSRPSARIPATRNFAPATSPRSSAATAPTRCALAAALYDQLVVDDVVPVSSRRDRRGGQADREHLPRRQHRARQRAEDRLRRDGHRHLGGDRGGQDQAVRLHAVLSRAGPRRPLHPDRSVLSDLEGARVRTVDALHRAGRRDQPRDAALS